MHVSSARRADQQLPNAKKLTVLVDGKETIRKWEAGLHIKSLRSANSCHHVCRKGQASVTNCFVRVRSDQKRMIGAAAAAYTALGASRGSTATSEQDAKCETGTVLSISQKGAKAPV